MSCLHEIKLIKQDGKLELDAGLLAAEPEMAQAIGELFDQHQDPAYHGEPMFRVSGGRLQVYDGGYDSGWSWGKNVTIHGYSAKPLLNLLAKHLKGGMVVFAEETEGWPSKYWTVKDGACRAATFG